MYAHLTCAISELGRYVVPRQLTAGMARRLIHPDGVASPVGEHRLDLHETTAAGTTRFEQGIMASAVGIFANADSCQKVVDLRPVNRLVGE